MIVDGLTQALDQSTRLFFDRQNDNLELHTYTFKAFCVTMVGLFVQPQPKRWMTARSTRHTSCSSFRESDILSKGWTMHISVHTGGSLIAGRARK